jgi:hypothetical protein
MTPCTQLTDIRDCGGPGVHTVFVHRRPELHILCDSVDIGCTVFPLEQPHTTSGVRKSVFSINFSIVMNLTLLRRVLQARQATDALTRFLLVDSAVIFKDEGAMFQYNKRIDELWTQSVKS